MAISTIADRCVLVRLKNGKPRMSRRDKTLEERVRAQEGDEGVVLTRKLFPNKNSPVHECNTLSNSIYAYHKKVSKPWLDDGPRTLLSERVDEYIHEMNRLIAELAPRAAFVRANWDQLVQEAIAYRTANAGPGSVAPTPDEYPSAADIDGMYNPVYAIRPIPDDGDFRTTNPAAEALYRQELAEAEETVRNATLMTTLQALRRAVDKLQVPIGEDGAVFRDSLVKNITSAVQEVEDYNLSNDPQITQVAQAIRDVLAGFNNNPEVLRTVQGARADTADRLKVIADKLGDL